jgi:diguanylate cyclase (GGDEF)-like protein
MTRYGLRLGALVERHMADAALVAARREAERQAEEAVRAKREIEAANVALHDEMAVRARAESRLAYLASHDPLTGLANSSLFSDRLSCAMEDARRHGERLALLCVDLDNFKDVNDTLGHAAGDVLLQQVSTRIESVLRRGETAGRMGGDEFAVLLRDPADLAATRGKTERLIALFETPFQIDVGSVFVTPSIGITVFPDDGNSVEQLRRNADLAMYRAKSDGGNRYHCFDETLNDEAHRRSFLEQALRDPNVMSQLYLAFQPQVDVRSHRVTGVEALLRWNHPTRGLIVPDDFVPILERSGLIIDVGAWLLRESCRQAVQWSQAGLPPLTMAVNVATAQFLVGDMPRVVAQVLAETGLPASRLELEITETGIMHDMRAGADSLIALHQQGVGLAIDDFGTGYSSLSYLRKLPIDRIKIDQSFVKDIPANEDAAVIVTTIVRLAHNLRRQVVAEGVETAAQSEFVRTAGCCFAQGFYYGRPTVPADLPLLLALLENTK